MTTIAHPSESMWIPGIGELNFAEMRAERAVQEYDPELLLGQDKRSGQWAVFVPHGPESPEPFPVLGLGHELPSPERIKQLLHESDVRRNSAELLDKIKRHADESDKKFSEAFDEGNQEIAEAIASHMRDQGTHPFPKVYMGGKRAKGKVRSA